MSIAASTDSGDSNGNNIFCVKIVTKGKRQVEPLRIEISTILRAVKGKGQNTNIPGSLHEDFLFTIELKDKPEMCFCMVRESILILNNSFEGNLLCIFLCYCRIQCFVEILLS